MAKPKNPVSAIENEYLKQYKRVTQAIRRLEKEGYKVPQSARPIKPSKVTNKKQETLKLIDTTPSILRAKSKIKPKQTKPTSIMRPKKYDESKVGGTKLKFTNKQIDVANKLKKEIEKEKKRIEKEEKKKQKEKQKPVGTTKFTAKYKPQDIINSGEMKELKLPKDVNLNTEIINKISSLLDSWQPERYWTPSFLERKTSEYHTINELWKEILMGEDEYELAYRLESNAEELFSLIERVIYDSSSPTEDEINMGRILAILYGRPLKADESDYYSQLGKDLAYKALYD